MDDESRPTTTERPWPPRLAEIVGVLVAAGVVAYATWYAMPANIEFATNHFYDPQSTDQMRAMYTAGAVACLTSGQWVGMLVALATGAGVALARGRRPAVLPLALLAGVVLAAVQAGIAVPSVIVYLQDAYTPPPEAHDGLVPPVSGVVAPACVVAGLAGSLLAAGLGAALASRPRRWRWIATGLASVPLVLLAYCLAYFALFFVILR